MRWVLRVFGFPVFDLAACEPEEGGWSQHTGGQFELAQEAPEAYYGEPDEEFGFKVPK